MATCECQTSKRHLALIEEAVEAAREAARLFPEDERLREEALELLALQARIEERLAPCSPPEENLPLRRLRLRSTVWADSGVASHPLLAGRALAVAAPAALRRYKAESQDECRSSRRTAGSR